MADANHLELIQTLARRVATGLHHLPRGDSIRRLDLYSLQRRQIRAGLVAAFNMFTALLDVGLNMTFLSSTRYSKVAAAASRENRSFR